MNNSSYLFFLTLVRQVGQGQTRVKIVPKQQTSQVKHAKYKVSPFLISTSLAMGD